MQYVQYIKQGHDMQPWDYYFTVPTWVRMEVSRSSHIKSNLLWLHNFEPKHKGNSTRPRKCEIHIFIVRIWLMICYFVLKLHAYLTLKKERVNRKSKSCHTQKEIVTSLRPKHWEQKNMHFTKLLRILCHTQQLSPRLFRTVLKNSSSFFKSKT